MKNNRLFLYRPAAAAFISNTSEANAEFLGELRADNINLSAKLQDISSISFDLPESILGEFNPRLNEVLENYVVELLYGNLDGVLNQDYFAIRFIIVKSEMSYTNGVKTYSYSANSLEHNLEYKRIFNWPGVLVRDLYRTIIYDKEFKRFNEETTGVDSPIYQIFESTNESKTKYIIVPTTLVGTDLPSPFDIFIYQHRRNSNDDIKTQTSIIEYLGSVNDVSFRQGYYIANLDINGKVTGINIALPDDIKEFFGPDKFFEIYLYDNPDKKEIPVGPITNQNGLSTDMYIDVAHNETVIFPAKKENIEIAIGSTSVLLRGYTNYKKEFNAISIGNKINFEHLSGDEIVTITGIQAGSSGRKQLNFTPALTKLHSRINVKISFQKTVLKSVLYEPLYGNYEYTSQFIYTKNGLTLKEILLGNSLEDVLTEDGVLFDTGFTIGEIHSDLSDKRRANIELNNISAYQAIKDLAESFDAIAVFDSNNKTVSFYPDKNEEAFTNNGLIITKDNYLKDIKNDIDSVKIITKTYAEGKDNMGIELITPSGSAAWEDYSYFLDSLYVEYDRESAIVTNATYDEDTGISFTSPFNTNTQSRWMDLEEAEKIAQWQYARDYFHDVMLGNLATTISEHTKYKNLYRDREAAIRSLVKKESSYFDIKSTEYNHKYIYDTYVKQNANNTNRRNKTIVRTYRSNITIEDPGATDFRLNFINLSSVTKMIINSTTDPLFFTSMTSTNNPRIRIAVTTGYVYYKLTSVDVFTNYVVLNLDFIKSTTTTTSLTNLQNYTIYFDTYEQIYKEKYDISVANSAAALVELDKIYCSIYNTRYDGSIPEATDSDYAVLEPIIQSSYATKISEVQSFLSKETWDIDIEKLNAFDKEAVMSDSKIDNRLDLMLAVQEFTKENSRPVITLSIDFADFLAAEQSKQDWNKAKIGDVINIYYPDFNIDTTAQIREMNVDFQTNSLSFVISTYRLYTRSPLEFLSRQIRRTYDNQYNKFLYKNDGATDAIKTSTSTKRIFNGDGFNAEKAPLSFGMTSSDGKLSSTEISGEGFVSNIIKVDPILETFEVVDDQTLKIADGTLISKKTVQVEDPEELDFISEVELSADNGLVIKKIYEDGVIEKQVYIDTEGNAIFAGQLVVNGNAQTIDDVFNNIEDQIDAGTTVYRADDETSLNAATASANTNDILLITESFLVGSTNYIKDDIYRFDGTVFVLDLDLKTKITGSVGGWTIDSTSIKSNNNTMTLYSDSTSNGYNPYISIGQSVQGYNNNGAFMGIVGETGSNNGLARLSLKSNTNSLLWDGTNLIVNGTIVAVDGSIAGYNIVNNAIYKNLITKTSFESTTDYNGWTTSGTWARSTVKAYSGAASMRRVMSVSTASAITYTFTTPKTSDVRLRFAFQFADYATTSFQIRKNNSSLITVSASSYIVNTWNIYEITIPFSSVAISTIEIYTTQSTGPAPTLYIDDIEIFEGTSIPDSFVNLGTSGLYLPNTSIDSYGLISNAGKIANWTISSDNLSSSGFELYSGTSPYLSISQATKGFGNDGIFLGVSSSNPKFSMVTDSGNTFLKYDPSATYDLEIAGNAKIGPLLIGNESTTARSLTLANGGFTVYTVNGGQSSVINTTNQFFEFIFGSIKIGSLITGFSFTASNTSTSRPYTVTLFLGNDSIATITGTVANGSNVVNFSSKTYYITRIRLTLGANFDGSTSILASNCTINGFKALLTVNDFFVSENGDIYSDDITLGTAAREKINIKGRNGGTSSRNISLTPAVLDGDRTITLPDVTGTAAIISENNTASTEFKVGRYTAAIGIDTRVAITFSTAFPTGLTYGVIVTPHGTNGMSLTGSNYLFGAESISNTGFTFVNDGVAAAAANGFSWIAFAY